MAVAPAPLHIEKNFGQAADVSGDTGGTGGEAAGANTSLQIEKDFGQASVSFQGGTATMDTAAESAPPPLSQAAAGSGAGTASAAQDHNTTRSNQASVATGSGAGTASADQDYNAEQPSQCCCWEWHRHCECCSGS
jgi:hypothetical protein